MQVSASTELVWQLAGQEAIAGQFEEIEPEHFCMAILKFSELPVEDMNKIAADSDVSRQLAADVLAVQRDLEGIAADATRARRRLRKRMGKGGCPNDTGEMHRSKASRTLIDAAAHLADETGEETLSPCHILAAILASPSALVKDALGGERKVSRAKLAALPYLDRYGRNLAQLISEGKLPSSKARAVEGKAILQALANPNNKQYVLLVTDDDDAAMQAVIEAAAVIASKQCGPNIKKLQIVDVTSIKSLPDKITGGSADRLSEAVEKLVAEASGVEGIVLVWPGISTGRRAKGLSRWGEVFKNMRVLQPVRCICRIAPRAYQEWIKQDSSWQRLIHTMWIRDRVDDSIPNEL